MKTPKVKEIPVEWETVHTAAPQSVGCSHYFEFVEGECRCRNCKMGLLGVVDIKNGRPI